MYNVMGFDKCIHPCGNEHFSENIKYFYQHRKPPDTNPSPPTLCSDFYHDRSVLSVLKFPMIKLA